MYRWVIIIIIIIITMEMLGESLDLLGFFCHAMSWNSSQCS
jgi:hypothetical protein